MPPTAALQTAPIQRPCTTSQGGEGGATDFSELRSSPVYLLINKKGDRVSQNMVLWAKAVFLCSLQQPSVALHLRPIISHRVSETDKTCEMSNDMKTADHSGHPVFASDFGVSLPGVGGAGGGVCGGGWEGGVL